jgi:hypothetical protein
MEVLLPGSNQYRTQAGFLSGLLTLRHVAGLKYRCFTRLRTFTIGVRNTSGSGGTGRILAPGSLLLKRQPFKVPILAPLFQQLKKAD